jgi:hypothetical protein
LEEKFKQNNVYNDNNFIFNQDEVSPLKRAQITNSSWLTTEQHSIKLINLAAQGDGNTEEQPAKFIDILKQILILPCGNSKNNVIATTMYIIPFHPREFGCAYLPTSTEVSPALEDSLIKEKLGLSAKQQVQLLLAFGQLAGHPIMYDVLPQTGRFSKPVLSNPFIARWFDVKTLISQTKEALDNIVDCQNQQETSAKEIISAHIDGNYVEIPEDLKEIVLRIETELDKSRKILSNTMMQRENQIVLHEKVKNVINGVLGYSSDKQLTEEDINEQGKVIGELISQGYWPAPGGAWNSCGIAVFDKMSEGASYPRFKHYDVEENDVTHFANLDCQTPYYFVNLETGEYNDKVVNFYVESLKKLQKDYNFDSFRVDHIDHIVDKVSEDNGRPISYRAPRKVLGLANTKMKELVPHFACLAEYMLWDNFLKEYHQDMNFDLLWGSDIISQYQKTPMKIYTELKELEEYNKTLPVGHTRLSILKTYNNQDGEFRAIDQYPGQLGQDGALFKFFKFKFMPMGEYAQRPVLFVDGDESFTKTGTEYVIGNEISMKREKNYAFYSKFDALNRLALNNEILTGGKTEILTFEEDGFVSWIVEKENTNKALLVVANWVSPTEKINETDEEGNSVPTIKGGIPVFKKSQIIPEGYKLISEHVFDKTYSDFVEIKQFHTAELTFDRLKASEFKIYNLIK